MEEILKVEAHDAEILCLEYSKPETGKCEYIASDYDYMTNEYNDGKLEECLRISSTCITVTCYCQV